MNKNLDEWLFKFAEITELQECLFDVLENSMTKNKKPYYAITLLSDIVKRSDDLYEQLNRYSMITDNCS